jgi:hypothetical protein
VQGKFLVRGRMVRRGLWTGNATYYDFKVVKTELAETHKKNRFGRSRDTELKLGEEEHAVYLFVLFFEKMVRSSQERSEERVTVTADKLRDLRARGRSRSIDSREMHGSKTPHIV